MATGTSKTTAPIQQITQCQTGGLQPCYNHEDLQYKKKDGCTCKIFKKLEKAYFKVPFLNGPGRIQ
jgi:hypothetical protein